MFSGPQYGLVRVVKYVVNLATKGASMANLFLNDLSHLSTADVEAFLALSSPEDQRPTETSRLDFKESFIPDIGDAVAALANTHGGLILIGVRADKTKQNIPIDMPGATNLGPDARARITDAILATVQPRPEIDHIGLVNGRTGGAVIAVIRVSEGTYPPYQFQRGATIRIPVRIQDTNRQATVREIEALLEKRKGLAKPSADVVAPYIGPDLYCTFDAPNGETRESDYHKIAVVPRVPLRLRQDTKFERLFEKLVLSNFPADHNLARKFGRGAYFQTERRMFAGDRTHRIWRSWSDGALGFIGNLTRPTPRGQRVGDLAADLLFSLRLATALFDSQNYHGAVVLSDELACSTANLVPEFPPPDGVGDYDQIPGIHLPKERPKVLNARSISIEEVDRATLESPEELVAQVILDQLRETWGASISFDKLLEAVGLLARQSKMAGWGKE